MITHLSKVFIHNLKFSNPFIGEKSVVFRTFKTKLKSKKKVKMSSSVDKPIKTFVFFDLETSDLIKGSKMPKIIELSMIAVSRDFIKSDETNKLTLPRILHKLTVAICPNQAINVESSIISNLWNHNLEDVKPFDENTYNLIMEFINRLPPTVCFVAHNGNRFDYPIFLSELKLLNKEFPENILCVDSLLAFREILNKTTPRIEQRTQITPEGYDEVDKKPLTHLKKREPKVPLDDEWNEALSSALDNYNKDNTSKNKYASQISSQASIDVLDTSNEQGDYNRPTTPECDLKLMQEINETTPKNRIIRNSQQKKISDTNKNLSSIKRQLHIVYDRPKNFKLSTIYEYLIGSEAENLHCAEADCISMLRCVCQIAPSFIEWVDCNAQPLNNFKKVIN